MQRISQERFQQELMCILKEIRRYRPQKVILFGSFARGDYHAASDIDLVIIKETDSPFVERIGDVLLLCGSSIPVEPLVYTPEEFEQMRRKGNPFIAQVLREGKVLMNHNLEEAHRWLAQARYDADAAALNAQSGYAALACFVAQQTAEKALKAYLYAQGERAVIGHATHLLAKRCQQYDDSFETLQDTCRQLDQYYIPTRYPNGLPGGIPHEVYTSEQAQKAVAGARAVLEQVVRLLPERGNETL